MTISVEHRTTGAEDGTAICNECRERRDTGNKTLIDIHKGYGDDAVPLTETEQDMVMGAAEDHQTLFKDHTIRVIYCHAR